MKNKFIFGFLIAVISLMGFAAVDRTTTVVKKLAILEGTNHVGKVLRMIGADGEVGYISVGSATSGVVTASAPLNIDTNGNISFDGTNNTFYSTDFVNGPSGNSIDTIGDIGNIDTIADIGSIGSIGTVAITGIATVSEPTLTNSATTKTYVDAARASATNSARIYADSRFIASNAGLGTNNVFSDATNKFGASEWRKRNDNDVEFYSALVENAPFYIEADGIFMEDAHAAKFLSTTQSTNRVAVFDFQREIISSTITTNELGYLAGVTGNIQTQISGKLSGTNSSLSTNSVLGTTANGTQVISLTLGANLSRTGNTLSASGGGASPTNNVYTHHFAGGADDSYTLSATTNEVVVFLVDGDTPYTFTVYIPEAAPGKRYVLKKGFDSGGNVGKIIFVPSGVDNFDDGTPTPAGTVTFTNHNEVFEIVGKDAGYSSPVGWLIEGHYRGNLGNVVSAVNGNATSLSVSNLTVDGKPYSFTPTFYTNTITTGPTNWTFDATNAEMQIAQATNAIQVSLSGTGRGTVLINASNSTQVVNLPKIYHYLMATNHFSTSSTNLVLTLLAGQGLSFDFSRVTDEDTNTFIESINLQSTNYLFDTTTGVAFYPGARGKITMFSTTAGTGDAYLDMAPHNDEANAFNVYGLRNNYTIDNENGTHSQGQGAILGEILFPPSNTNSLTGRQTGLYGYVHHAGTGTLSDTRAVYGIAGIYGSGNIGFMRGGYFNTGISTNTTGSAENAIGAEFPAHTDEGSGSIANAYGIKLAAQTVGTNQNWAVYSEGTNYLKAILVGTTANTSNGVIVLNSTATNNGIAIGARPAEVIYRSAQDQITTGSRFIATLGLTFGDDLLPGAHNSYDFGKTANRLRNIWAAGTIETGSSVSGGTIVSGTTIKAGTSIIATTTMTATNGFASYSTNRTTLAATGYTNILTVGGAPVNVDVYFSAVTAALQDSDGNIIHTYSVFTGELFAHMKPNWRLVGTTMAGDVVGH